MEYKILIGRSREVQALFAESRDSRWNPDGAVVFDPIWGTEIKYSRCTLSVPLSFHPEIVSAESGYHFLKLAADGFGMKDGTDNYIPVCRYEENLYAYFDDKENEIRYLMKISF